MTQNTLLLLALRNMNFFFSFNSSFTFLFPHLYYFCNVSFLLNFIFKSFSIASIFILLFFHSTIFFSNYLLLSSISLPFINISRVSANLLYFSTLVILFYCAIKLSLQHQLNHPCQIFCNFYYNPTNYLLNGS